MASEGDGASTSWRPFLAFVLPFVLFAVLTTVEANESLAAWYPWLYALKLLVIAIAIGWGWRSYPRWTGHGIGWGFLYGLVGGVLWIILCNWNVEKDVLPTLLEKWGLQDWLKPGSRVGYEPFAKLGMLQAYLFIFIRLVGLVIIVPLLEELFWRGFLNRIIVDENWQQVPWGKMSRWSIVILTVAFVLVHTEWTAALVWVMGMHFLYMKTKNLWACVVAHAASNAVLGYYILAYGQWQLW